MQGDIKDPRFQKELLIYTSGIASRIAKAHPYIHPHEIRSAALLGLAEALDRYNPNYSTNDTLIPFILKNVRGRIMDAVRNEIVRPLGITYANSRHKEPRLRPSNIHSLRYKFYDNVNDNGDQKEYIPDNLKIFTTPLHKLLRKEQLALISTILNKIPSEKARKVWKLYVLEGYTLPEIAELTNRTLCNVHQHINKHIGTVRRMLTVAFLKNLK